MIVLGIGWILQAALIAGWLTICSLYFRGAWILGHFPYVSRDDPKDLHLGLHFEMTGVAIIVVMIATFLSCLLAGVFGVAFALAQRTPQSTRGLQIAWRLFVSGAVSLVLWFLFPFVPWWLD